MPACRLSDPEKEFPPDTEFRGDDSYSASTRTLRIRLPTDTTNGFLIGLWKTRVKTGLPSILTACSLILRTPSLLELTNPDRASNLSNLSGTSTV
jgi:hypothetical protein